MLVKITSQQIKENNIDVSQLDNCEQDEKICDIVQNICNGYQDGYNYTACKPYDALPYVNQTTELDEEHPEFNFNSIDWYIDTVKFDGSNLEVRFDC